MEIDHEETRSEVVAAFMRYEEALVGNDLVTLDALFWADPRTVRFGIGEALFGIEAVRAFRRARPAADLARTLQDTVITSFGRDFATASTLFTRATTPGRSGRQQQSWARIDGAWRIVAAHVSMIDVA